MHKVIFAWSGGKDSSYALWQTLQDPNFEVVALMTTFNIDLQRVSMHGTHIDLTRQQAQSIGLPLIEMTVSESTNTHYEEQMRKVLDEYKGKHQIAGVVFGDIFLEDLRTYRENNLAQVDLKGFFPLWKKDTHALSKAFIEEGFKTRICCVSDAYLNENHVGQDYDYNFLSSLPSEVDPCGENGEFHSFCYDGPIFSKAIKIKNGERVYKELEAKYVTEESLVKGFYYVELSEKVMSDK